MKMNTRYCNSEELYRIARKPHRIIIGLMSGTSLDGLDIALCRVSGSDTDTVVEVLEFETVGFDTRYRQEIESVFSRRQVDLQKVCLLNAWVGVRHAEMIRECLSKWNIDTNQVDLIASHGQTIYHAPKKFHQLSEFGNATLQIGDADHIAYRLGIISCSDFRQKNIAAGGEGAPLAAYGDYYLFSSQDENRVLLNIGGIANITVLPASMSGNFTPSSDVGPGNIMMDALVRKQGAGLLFDSNAAIALRGKVHTALLKALKQHEFIRCKMPKTIGPELFNLSYIQCAQTASGSEHLPLEDILATLNRFSAECIVDAINQATQQTLEYQIYVSGGGVFNPLLMNTIEALIRDNQSLHSTSVLGIEPEMKEAVLFAVLANECIVGTPFATDDSYRPLPAVTMGKLSFAK